MTTHEEQTMTDPPEESPITETPRMAGESTPGTAEQAPGVETPAPAVETPAPGVETPAPGVETPAPAAETPAPSVEAPEAEPPAAEHEPRADEALFAGDDLADLRARWAGVQAAFVDDPKDCVQKADALVSDLVEQLTTRFARARSRLEEQWSQGKEASTEDLRLALMHYREFFERLLAV
jgi:hypothetical protein